jgi:hypothetical protein
MLVAIKQENSRVFPKTVGAMDVRNSQPRYSLVPDLWTAFVHRVWRVLQSHEVPHLDESTMKESTHDGGASLPFKRSDLLKEARNLQERPVDLFRRGEGVADGASRGRAKHFDQVQRREKDVQLLPDA